MPCGHGTKACAHIFFPLSRYSMLYPYYFLLCFVHYCWPLLECLLELQEETEKRDVVIIKHISTKTIAFE